MPSRPLGRLISLALAAVLAATSLPGSLARAGESPSRSTWETRLKQLDQADAKAAYRLALELEAAGAKDLAAKAHEIVLGIAPDHRASRRALGYERVHEAWLRGDALKRAKGFLKVRDVWLTAAEYADATRPERLRAKQLAGEKQVWSLLERIASEDEATVRDAHRKLAGLADPFKLAPMAKALRVEPLSLRLFAAKELGRLGDERAIPALLKRAIYDPEAKGREGAVDALKAIHSPATIGPLARALNSRYADVRVHAAQAIGRLRDVAGMGYVMHKWVGRSGDFPRSYIATLNQLSYIQDFDVEVAQTSFIADPVVGVLQEGVVHSVKIHAAVHTFTTYEAPEYHKALVKLSGQDLGKGVQPWLTYWHKNKDRLLREQEAAYQAE